MKALSQIFVVLGRNITSVLVRIVSVAVPIFVGIFAITELGIIGASVARGLSLIIALVVSVVVLRRSMRLRFQLRAYGYAWLASLLMAGVVLLMQKLVYSVRLFPVYVVVGGLVYLLLLRWLRVIDREDLDLISDFLGPRFRFVARWLERFFR